MRVSRPTWLRSLVLSLGLVACVAVTGCGAKTSNVKGKVTYGGKSVVWGSVTLVDEKGMFHQGPINLDGTYTIPNVPVGKVKIGVFSPKPDGTHKGGRGAVSAVGGKGDPNDPRDKFKSAPPPEPPKPQPGAWFPLPDKFVEPEKSGLTGEVKSSKETVLDVDLK